MSKIKIDDIESLTTNGDLKITPDGNGVFEVAGEENDGTLQLNSVGNTNKVKIKSPNSSAAQNYTMILPASGPTNNKFLKVDTISGSGSNAVGQLSFADEPTLNITSINASNISSGVLDSNRFGTLSPQDAGLQFVSKHSVGATGVNEIIITGFEADTQYLLIGKNITTNSNISSSHGIKLTPLQSDDSVVSSQVTQETWHGGDSNTSVSSADHYLLKYSRTGSKFSFMCEINNLSSYGGMFARGWMVSSGINQGKMELYGSFRLINTRIYKLKIHPYNTSNTFTQNTQFLLYKYLES